MSKLSKQIRKYVKCPQFDSGYEYGEWGILTLTQRRLIKELCEECERQEKYADTFFKETQTLKHQLAEKDKEVRKRVCAEILYLCFPYFYEWGSDEIINRDDLEEIFKKVQTEHIKLPGDK